MMDCLIKIDRGVRSRSIYQSVIITESDFEKMGILWRSFLLCQCAPTMLWRIAQLWLGHEGRHSHQRGTQFAQNKGNHFEHERMSFHLYHQQYQHYIKQQQQCIKCRNLTITGDNIHRFVICMRLGRYQHFFNPHHRKRVHIHITYIYCTSKSINTVPFAKEFAWQAQTASITLAPCACCFTFSKHSILLHSKSLKIFSYTT